MKYVNLLRSLITWTLAVRISTYTISPNYICCLVKKKRSKHQDFMLNYSPNIPDNLKISGILITRKSIWRKYIYRKLKILTRKNVISLFIH